MLSDYPLGARLPIEDYDRARAFYVDVLGLSPVGEFPGDGISFAPGDGTKFALYTVPKHDIRPVAAWGVDDVEAEVAILKQRGVTFEEYEGRSVNSIISSADKRFHAAFFRDSEGNLLVITHHPQ